MRQNTDQTGDRQMRNPTRVVDTRISGSVTFYDEHTGEVQSRSVNFKSRSDAAWVDIVDEATAIARDLLRSNGGWVYETDDLVEA